MSSCLPHPKNPILNHSCASLVPQAKRKLKIKKKLFSWFPNTWLSSFIFDFDLDLPNSLKFSLNECLKVESVFSLLVLLSEDRSMTEPVFGLVMNSTRISTSPRSLAAFLLFSSFDCNLYHLDPQH
ncbi:hypothetical protein BpHYR1_035727 [Brachionus plicatilis]|uniref:Uncharacterized protein n=1 Tax=Brachionus plicatilis TaxID=10195 RepID=A0A3M7SZ55_BRAPC|nr:hypothetical protein BpHYR1_035727 [Brachionus plicatilis]